MNSKKLKNLLNFGLSLENLLKLDESKIDVLHKSLVESKKTKKETNEQTPPGVTKKTVSTDVFQINPGAEMAVGDMLVKNVGGKAEVMAKKTATEGEVAEGNKKRKKQKKVNPWAVCHSQLGPKKTEKFERCVKKVKKSIKEGTDPYSVVLEEKVLSLVEKHIKPKMKKGELMDLIGKKKMNLPIGKLGSMGAVTEDSETAPVKPAKPGTKTPPKTTPSHPGKNPNPGVKPAPKAGDDELDIETKPYKSKPDFDSDEILKYIKELQKKEEERRRTLERKRKKEEEEKKHSKEKEEEKKRTVKPEKSETKESTETAPVKPAKPGTKTPPKTTPSHPGKNPNPGVKPAPKAEKAKENMISSIIQILKKGK